MEGIRISSSPKIKIMTDRKGNQFRILLVGLFLLSLFMGCAPQDAKVHQRKLNHDREKKEAAAMKSYQNAVKQHNKNQSKETKAMMKQARKSTGKNTPLKHSSGTKCK